MEKSNIDNSNGIVLQNQWCPGTPLPKARKDTLRILFCRQGNVTIILNGILYEMQRKNMLIAFPDDVMKVTKYGQYFSGSYLFIPLKLLEQFSLFSPQNWKTYSTIKGMQQLCLEEDNIRLLHSYLNLLEIRLNHPSLADSNAGLYSLISTFIRDFLSIAAKQRHRQECLELSAANSLFNKFIRLLYASDPQKQTLEYYADKLCVTPKYLSAVCKHVAGETASTIINRCLTNEIRNRLIDSDKPIQTIAYELGFANQSFFGKYVKAHLGMTASQFRESRGYR